MYLIIGKDKEEIRRALSSFLAESPMPLFSFYPENFSEEAFFQEVETFPFLSKGKKVVIHDVDHLLEQGIKVLCRYLEKPNSWISLYLTASELSSQNKIVKLVEQKGKVLRFKEEKIWEKEKRLSEWLIEEAQKENTRLSAQAAIALVQGVDHQMLKAELDKLICFAYSRKEITIDDISILSTRVHHETLWQLGDALLSRACARALEIGTVLLEEGMSIFLLLANLRSQFATGLEILAAAERGEAAKKFPYLKGNLLEKKLKMLKKYGKSYLQHGALLIFETEVKAKNSSVEPSLLLEILIIKLTHDFISTPQLVGTS